MEITPINRVLKLTMITAMLMVNSWPANERFKTKMICGPNSNLDDGG